MTDSRRPSRPRWGDDLGLWVAIGLAAGAALLLISALAQAQPAQEPLELPTLTLEPCPDAGALQALQGPSGDPGMWFPRETSRCMLARLVTFQRAIPYIHLLESRLQLDDERNALQERRVSMASEESARATGALQEAIRGRLRAESRARVWYRRPSLWFAMGALVTVALEALSVWAYSQVSR